MRTPTTAEVLRIHSEVLRTGEARGILNVGAIESALFRCRHGPFYEQVDEFDRVALLLRGLCQDHPFADGNKRTAFLTAYVALRMNGHRLSASSDAVVDFMLAVAQDQLDVAAIALWLRRHSQHD